MKKSLLALLALLLTSLMACGTPAPITPTPAPTAAPTQTEAAEVDVVSFDDPALETMVLGAMGKTGGKITVAEAKTVTSLHLAFPEWQKFLSETEPIRSIAGLENFTGLENLDLSGNAITDLAPLSALSNLKALLLTGCTAQDYTPLAGLTNLRVLMLDHSTIADPTPLLALSKLNCLYIAGSQIKNYMPLADVRASLELADFDVAFTLAELGFTFNDNDKLALYQTDEYDIRMNHSEWGDPPRQDWKNCIRVVTGAESGYKNEVGFYPEHNAYVAWMFNVNTQQSYTYVYDVAQNTFGCERADMEPIVREAFGDVNDQDILLAPVVFFDNTIQDALGIPIDVLNSMPFDENIVLQSPYEKLGFAFVDYRGIYSYEDNGVVIEIHKPEWDGNVNAGQALDWSMSFFDPNVKEYKLQILYFADRNVYYISLEKDGVEVRFDYYPDEDRFEYNPNDIDPLRQTLNEALGTEGDGFMKVPMDLFTGNIQERFHMSIEELYALE